MHAEHLKQTKQANQAYATIYTEKSITPTASKLVGGRQSSSCPAKASVKLQMIEKIKSPKEEALPISFENRFRILPEKLGNAAY